MDNKKFITRRLFLRRVTAVTFGGLVAGSVGWPLQRLLAQNSDAPVFNYVDDGDNPLAEEHAIDIRMPLIAEDGSNVPIVITMENHPMEADHYIKSIQMINFKDPVVGKGLYHLTPANGQAYLASQIRLDGGDAEVWIIAECSQHGKWVANASLKVSLGGC
jgi:predicted secreted protein